MSYDELVAQADRAALAAFGELVMYKPQSGAAVPVTGIFDVQFLLAKGSANASVEALGPAVFFRLEDLPTDPEVDDPTITIGAVVYRVVERRSGGIGGIVLVLRGL